MSLFKMFFKYATHPIALGAIGGYVGHKLYGDNKPKLSIAGGAGVGLATGFLVQRTFFPTQAQQIPETTIQNQQSVEEQRGQAYVNLGPTDPDYQGVVPVDVVPGAMDEPEEGYVPEDVEAEHGMGSFDEPYGNDIGDQLIDELVEEARGAN